MTRVVITVELSDDDWSLLLADHQGDGQALVECLNELINESIAEILADAAHAYVTESPVATPLAVCRAVSAA